MKYFFYSIILRSKPLLFPRIPLEKITIAILAMLLLVSNTIARGHADEFKFLEKTISGKVTNNEGKPLAGVSITIKGTSKGTVTDNNGQYYLSVTDNTQEIIISLIGYKTKIIPINEKLVVDVILETDASQLAEVVVAFGTQKKRNVTGAISQINASEVSDMPVPNIGQKMQGKFSGVQIYQTSGEPNGGLSFRIRGSASINAGNMPLVIIDGFASISGMETLSPDEIQSITVLKDASAAALYGSRAANGVILITTKSGKSGATDIQFSANYGIEKVSNRGRPDLMNAQEFAEFKKEWYEDAAKYEGYTGGVPAVYQNPDQVQDGTDWYRVLLRPAASQNYNLGIATGSSKLKSAFNLNYNKQEGVVVNTYAERFTARANNLFTVSDGLTFGLNLQGSFRKSQITPGLAGTGNGRLSIASAFLMDPQLKYKNDDGTYPVSFSQPGMFANPNYYLWATQRENPSRQTSGLANAFGELRIIKGLKYKFSANVDLGNIATESFIPSTAQGALGSAPPLPATGGYATRNYLTWLIENTLTYTKTINGKHNFDAFIGYTVQKARDESSTIAATGFPDDAVDWFNAAATKNGSGTKTFWSMLSYVGRLNYNYDGKYLISLAFRSDGCSRFGSNARWGNFPSVSIGWIASDENFMKNFNKISYLKLRASYGKVGNNNIGDYSSIAAVSTANYVLNNTIAAGRGLSAIGNNDLTWETTEQYDLGVDLGLFNDRIHFVYDYYLKNTSGLLYAIDIPVQAGFSSIQSNIGEFRFWGHEFAIESKNLVGKFRWTTNFNISFNRNKAIKLGTNNTPIGGTRSYDDYNRTQVGHPLGEFFAFLDDGVYMTQEEFDKDPKYSSSMIGSSRVKDTNGDGVITFDDRAVCGDPNPDFLYGMTNEFTYKNFDADIVIAGAGGVQIFDGTMSWTENIDGVFNVLKEVKNRWRSPENPGDGVIPRTFAGTTNLMHFGSDRWVQPGDYLAVKNVTLGYTIPMKHYVKSARLYFSAQNILMLTKYHGLNPEVSIHGENGLTNGVDASAYPISITYSLGLNVKF